MPDSQSALSPEACCRSDPLPFVMPLVISSSDLLTGPLSQRGVTSKGPLGSACCISSGGDHRRPAVADLVQARHNTVVFGVQRVLRRALCVLDAAARALRTT